LACDGFLPEQYGLYSLGSLENAEAHEISTHLRENCETCVREVRQYLALWTIYAEAATPLAPAPVKRDWSAILSKDRSGRPRFTERWRQWGAVAAAILLVSGLSVSIAVLRFQTQQRRTDAELRSTRQQLNEAEQQREAAQAALNRVPPPVAPVPEQRPSAAAENQLRQLLRNAQQELAQTRQTLDSSRAQLSETQTTLNQQQQELASLRRSTTDLQTRLSTAERNQSQALERVQTLQTRVRELETDRQRLQDVVNREQRRAAQNTQVISYLEAPGTRLIPLSGTEAAASARGYLLLTRDNQLLFSEAGLPALPPGRTYQLWLLRSRGEPVVSGGLFTGSGGGQNQIVSNNSNLALGLNAVAVTEEPAGGSRLPSGRKVLIGTVRS
jgi:hypothetical protein